MFVVKNENMRLPVKIWLNNIADIEPGCLEQAINLSNLPFAYHHIALLPDTHQGYGMPIGGVLATEKVVIPNAVGVDIGCGMCYLKTNIPAQLLRETETERGTLAQMLAGMIMRAIPVGFDHHKERQDCLVLDRAIEDGFMAKMSVNVELLLEVEGGYYQVGTLGGGNHFIEIQESSDGKVSIMLHSGSRNFGYKICKYFNSKAKELNAKWFSSVPPEWDLAFLPVESEEGKQYLVWMDLALRFAAENREKMLYKVREILYNSVKKYAGFEGIKEGEIINCHHNYAAIENHFGKNVWVHRKGAIQARVGDMGIIPGSMGSKSYIVRGKGCKESFDTCSHGAGRAGSRKWAKNEYSIEEVMSDLKEKGVVLGKHKVNDVAEECRWAYKEIDQVMANQTDLVDIVEELKTIVVVKG